MKKKRVGILCAVAAAAVIAAVCWRTLGQTGADGDGNVVYVNSVATLTGLGSGNGMINRFAGVVESQDTWSVQQNAEKTVREVLVSVGQEVTVGTPLFTYDTEKFQSDLAQAQLDLERIQNEISNMNAAISDLEKERKKADSASQATYTLQIQEQQLQVKQREFDAQSKQLEIDKLNENINNATVSSEIDGVVKSINNGNSTDMYGNGDNSFITVMKTGEFRIKGKMNEQNMGALSEGAQVVVHSRTEDGQTWKGTITRIDWDNPEANQNAMYSGSSDNMSSSNNYPFYVDLEDSTGLRMGQHVYLEMDYGQTEKKDGLWLDEYLIDMTDPKNPFVWADNGNGRLEKRAVTLGGYDENMMQYEILDGLTVDDSVTFPEAGLEEGMPTAVSENGMMGQSNSENTDGEVPVTDGDMPVTDEGMTDGGDMSVTDEGTTDGSMSVTDVGTTDGGISGTDAGTADGGTFY